MKYKVIKSKRRKRTYSMNIDSSGRLVVRVPARTTNKQVEKFVQKNHRWINNQKTKLQQNPKDTTHVYYLGQKYLKEFKSHNLKRPKLKFENGEFVFYRNGTISKRSQSKLLEKYYKQQGKIIIPPLVEKYELLVNEKHNKITVKNIKSRWGSCSSKKNLNFSVHLLKTPIDCVEYVIAHEVCHLKHQNHSKSFWDLVEQVYPEFKLCEKHLKDNYHLYT